MPAGTRRWFLGVAAGLALAGCGRRREQLRVFVYAGGHEKTMREVFVPAFEEETGAQVVLDPGWWDAIPKLKASPPGQSPFDLVITDATQGYPAIKEGLFQKIDLANVPNHKLLTPPSSTTGSSRKATASPTRTR
jgi:spermidine/putrescine-binding protein